VHNRTTALRVAKELEAKAALITEINALWLAQRRQSNSKQIPHGRVSSSLISCLKCIPYETTALSHSADLYRYYTFTRQRREMGTNFNYQHHRQLN
jgi:hypothetical protein